MVERINTFAAQPKVGDFFAPFFTVRFLAATDIPARNQRAGEGRGGNRSGTRGPVVEPAEVVAPGTEEFRNYITRLTITNKGGGPSFVEMTLEPPYQDALALIDQQALQWNSLMVVQWGWASNNKSDVIKSDRHIFRILQPRLSMTALTVTITVSGVDVFSSATAERDRRTRWPRDQFKTDLDIITAIVATLKMQLDLTLLPPDSGLRVRKPRRSRGHAALLVPAQMSEPTIIEQNESSWAFFERLCASNNTSFFIRGDTVCLVDREFSKTRPESYRLVQFTQPEKATDIPMFSFASDAIPTLFQPPASKETTVATFDHDAGLLTRQKYEPQLMSDARHLGAKNAAGKGSADGRVINLAAEAPDPTAVILPNPAYQVDETGKFVSMPSQKANQEEHGKQIARNAAQDCNTKAKVTIPGVPKIVPLQTVLVNGVGKTLGGLYQILNVVHRLGAQFYECDLELSRDARSGDETVGKGTKNLTGSEKPKGIESGESVTPSVVG